MNTKLITFYSYKGGAGRSSTAINTLPFLVNALNATAKRPLLLLDMDLDSAGMTYLLECDTYFQSHYDVKQFLLNEERWPDVATEDLASHALLSKFLAVGNLVGVENGAVLFLGDNDETPIDNEQMDGTKELTLKKLFRFCRKNNLPGIVIDSASGDQFAAVLSVEQSTDVVCCMRPTAQFRIGTFNYLRRLANNNTESHWFLLPTVVPEQDVEIDGEFQKNTAIHNISRRCERLRESGMNITTDFVTEDMFGINEVQRFMWQEGVLYKIAQSGDLKADEQKAYNRYRRLAEIIANDGD